MIHLFGVSFIKKVDYSKEICLLKNESHKLLKSFAHVLRQAGIFNVNAISLVGDPRQEIETKIDKVKPDLVILGSRGLNSFSRFMVYSRLT